MASQFDAARARFSEDLRAHLLPDEMKKLRADIEAADGAFLGVEGAESLLVGAYRSVLVTLKFARTRIILRVVYEGDRAAGIWFEPVPADLEATVRGAVAALEKRDFPAAEARFHDKMRAALPPADLARRWTEVDAKFGAFREIDAVVPQRDPPYWQLVANCRFERSTAGVQFVFDMHGRVVGFFVGEPAVPASAWAPPPYVDAARFEERRVVVGSKPPLPGALVVPKGVAKAPVVILVHGSGPGDMDESISLNRAYRMFKDLAFGLGSRGIAVLRHDKRTKIDPSGVLTVEQEYVDSIRAAMELVKATPGLDPTRVVVLGHSLGGTIAPRIAKEVPGVAALAILAGSTRSLPDSMIMQLTYFQKLDPDNRQLPEEIARAKRLKALIEDPMLKPDQKLEGMGGTTGAYFLDLRGYDHARAAADLSIPMLVLQGERDYQVTVDELETWERTLQGKSNVATKRYPALNHFFMPGTGTPTPEDYRRTNHVAPEVVADVADFVLRLR